MNSTCDTSAKQRSKEARQGSAARQRGKAARQGGAAKRRGISGAQQACLAGCGMPP